MRKELHQINTEGFGSIFFFRLWPELIAPTYITISILYENLKSIITPDNSNSSILCASLLIKQKNIMHNGEAIRLLADKLANDHQQTKYLL